jgi:phospholipase/carboxylesterase
MTRNLVIRPHGVGSNGVDLADAWRHALPDTEFAAPDAPLSVWPRLPPSGVRKGVTETKRRERVAAGADGVYYAMAFL